MVFDSNFVICSGPHREFAQTPEEAAGYVKKFLEMGCRHVDVQKNIKNEKRRQSDKIVTNTY